MKIKGKIEGKLNLTCEIDLDKSARNDSLGELLDKAKDIITEEFKGKYASPTYPGVTVRIVSVDVD